MNCSNCATCEVSEARGCGTSSVFDWLYSIPKNKIDTKIVEVEFKKGRKEYYKNQNNIGLKKGDAIMVEGDQEGYNIGTISLSGPLVELQLKRKNITNHIEKTILGFPSQGKIDKWKKTINKESQILKESKEIIKKHGLDMKLSTVETQADNKQTTFYYTATKRIDFRELIKSLSKSFKTRIQMQQIGMRQEAAKLGGIGSCGRELCCSTWMTEMPSVQTSAVRYQQLAINPTKISGQCGRLKCCLNFELETYLEELDSFPNPKTRLKTKKGEAKYFKMDVFKNELWYFYTKEQFQPIKLKLKEVLYIIKMNKKGVLPKSLEITQK